MRKLNTHKRMQAISALRVYENGSKTRLDYPAMENDVLYGMMAQHDATWDSDQQIWRARQPGTRGPAKHPIVKAHSFGLIRIMATREILDTDRENFALAFEAIGYEIVDFSQPIENRENGYSRVYIKARSK